MTTSKPCNVTNKTTVRLPTHTQDYLQYYMDLEKANADGDATWLLEYRATDEFSIEDISVASMAALAQQLKSSVFADDDDAEFGALMQKFAVYNSVSYVNATCATKCRLHHACAITAVGHDEHDRCVAETGGGGGNGGEVPGVGAWSFLLAVSAAVWASL